MIITADDDESIRFVKARIELIAGSFPQLRWDINMTVTSWMLMLSDIKTTSEELNEATRRVISNGFQDWEINLSLIIDLIRELRRENQLKKPYTPPPMSGRRLTPDEIHQKIEEWKKETI